MKSNLFLTVLVSLFVILSACGKRYEGGDAAPQVETAAFFDKTAAAEAKMATEEQTAPAPPPSESANADGDAPIKVGDNPSAANRKIIYTGNLRFQVKDLKETGLKVKQTAEKFGGYLANETFSRAYRSEELNYTLRVPANKFNDFLQAIEPMAEYVESRSVQAADVTQEFVDVESRLKAKREAEAQYYTILKQARNVNEILGVQAELRKIHEEIEATTARLKSLQDQTSFSTVTLSLYVPVEGSPAPQDGFFYQTFKALGNGWEGLLGFIVGFVSLWPLWLIGGGAFYGVRKFLQRRKAKKMAPTNLPKE